MIFGPRYASRFRGYWKTDSESRLLAVVESALRDVPFYAQRYKGIRITSAADFKAAFSTIDKDVVLGDYEAFTSTAIDRSRYDECTTGGTSGKPLRLLLPRDRYVHEYAALHRMWSKVGYRFSPRAVVRNERIVGRDFIINPILREYVFDGFRSSEEYLERIYEVMKHRNIGFYHGYTSNAHEFARFLLRRGLDHSFLKAFITTSENFYPHQKAVFDALPGVKHMNFYGHSEKLVLAEYCSASGLYHFHQQYGFCELLDEFDRDVVSIGEVGEIVGSTLYNVGMPLLRYRTGDYARYAGVGQCAHCGHQGMSATEILGRWAGDRVYNADGSYVTTTALNLHSDLYARIAGLQYVQSQPGELLVRVIPGSGYDSSVAERLRAVVAAKMASATSVSVEEVRELEKSANGKFLLSISRRDKVAS
ncbi:phenylacetate-CoA ligase [Lysobacter niabensis]|uniref:Phenylacetate-CoA ligase n=1 Tax=Agrilutibacter niabensis TaxID=380628 RepID=A0ABU1VLF4_9GAMM|nr:hypothetical protein [Lysobacter niabensis]MDR7098304.1 phenylacetate-CoA ligase [Lysobacter niabensis]